MQSSYAMARDWGIQPSEFRAMDIEWWWWEFAAKVEVQHKINNRVNQNGMSEEDWDDLVSEYREKYPNGHRTNRS